MVKILFVVTSANTKGTDKQPAGVWYEELAAPYNYFTSRGFDVVLSSVKGGEIPVDPASLGEGFKTADVDQFISNESAVATLKSSAAVESVDVSEFDAVFVPGGLAVMLDMPENASVAKVLSDAWAQGKVVSAVCHGPGAFLSAKTPSGEPLVKAKRVTGFSNSEEEATGNTHNVPYLLEDKLKELGGLYEKADDWAVFALRDGKLITGQNPASSKRVAELVEEALMT